MIILQLKMITLFFNRLNSRLLHQQSLIDLKSESTEGDLQNEESLSDRTSVSSDEIMMQSTPKVNYQIF